MLRILYSYLIQRKALFLPGIGHFRIYEGAARFDITEQKIIAASSTVIITEEQPQTQKELFLYISHKLQISELEAIQQFNTCVFELRQALKSGKSVEWEELGLLSAGEKTSDIILMPFTGGFNYLPPVKAGRIVKDKAHALKVGDEETDSTTMQERLFGDKAGRGWHWGWYALILALIALFFLGYHLLSSNGIPFTGNRQGIF